MPRKTAPRRASPSSVQCTVVPSFLPQVAYKALREYFFEVTEHPDRIQCEALAKSISKLPGCQGCTAQRIQSYFREKRKTEARARRSSVPKKGAGRCNHYDEDSDDDDEDNDYDDEDDDNDDEDNDDDDEDNDDDEDKQDEKDVEDEDEDNNDSDDRSSSKSTSPLPSSTFPHKAWVNNDDHDSEEAVSQADSTGSASVVLLSSPAPPPESPSHPKREATPDPQNRVHDLMSLLQSSLSDINSNPTPLNCPKTFVELGIWLQDEGACASELLDNVAAGAYARFGLSWR